MVDYAILHVVGQFLAENFGFRTSRLVVTLRHKNNTQLENAGLCCYELWFYMQLVAKQCCHYN